MSKAEQAKQLLEQGFEYSPSHCAVGLRTEKGWFVPFITDREIAADVEPDTHFIGVK